MKFIAFLLCLFGNSVFTVSAASDLIDCKDPRGLRMIVFGKADSYPGDLAKAQSHFQNLFQAMKSSTAPGDARFDALIGKESGYPDDCYGQLCFVDVVAASGQFEEAVNWACLPGMPLHMHWQFAYS